MNRKALLRLREERCGHLRNMTFNRAYRCFKLCTRNLSFSANPRSYFDITKIKNVCINFSNLRIYIATPYRVLSLCASRWIPACLKELTCTNTVWFLYVWKELLEHRCKSQLSLGSKRKQEKIWKEYSEKEKLLW